jgi:hypothetical protein
VLNDSPRGCPGILRYWPSRLQFAMEVADIILLGGCHLVIISLYCLFASSLGSLGAVKPHEVLSRLGMRETASPIGQLQLKMPSHVCLYWSSVKRAGRI